MKIRIAQYVLYTLIVVMIFFILGNYKYQPILSADEVKAIEEVKELREVQEDFITKSNSPFSNIDLSIYKVNSGYSDLLLIIQDLLQLKSVSGYYNEETVIAIENIQQKAQLEVTGEIDEDTFIAIMDKTLPLSESDLRTRGDFVRILQRQFNLADDGILGESTRQAIEQLKIDLHAGDQTLVYDVNLIDDTIMAYIIGQLNS